MIDRRALSARSCRQLAPAAPHSLAGSTASTKRARHSDNMVACNRSTCLDTQFVHGNNMDQGGAGMARWCRWTRHLPGWCCVGLVHIVSHMIVGYVLFSHTAVIQFQAASSMYNYYMALRLLMLCKSIVLQSSSCTFYNNRY